MNPKRLTLAAVLSLMALVGAAFAYDALTPAQVLDAYQFEANVALVQRPTPGGTDPCDTVAIFVMASANPSVAGSHITLGGGPITCPLSDAKIWFCRAGEWDAMGSPTTVPIDSSGEAAVIDLVDDDRLIAGDLTPVMVHVEFAHPACEGVTLDITRTLLLSRVAGTP